MAVHPVETSLPRRNGRLSADDLAERTLLGRFARSIEDHGYGAATNLVHLRDDLAEAANPENNRLLERALRVAGLPPLARELIQAALLVEIAEEQAVARARLSRDYAHIDVKAINGAVELAITGRQRNRPAGRPTVASQPALIEEGL